MQNINLKGVSIDHIYLTVSDLQLSEAFYDKLFITLGFEKKAFELQSDPHIQYFNCYFCYILRPAKSKCRHDSLAPGLHHLCFRVAEIDEVQVLQQELNGLGIKTTDSKFYAEYADDYYAFYFLDPDGVELEVTNFRKEQRDRFENG